MSKIRIQRIIITVLCFLVDVIASGIYTHQIIIASFANFCILSWIASSWMLPFLSGLFCLLAAAMNGYDILAETFFLGGVFLSIFFMKQMLAESSLLTFLTTFVMYILQLLLLERTWTLTEIIANILIISLIVYFQE